MGYDLNELLIANTNSPKRNRQNPINTSIYFKPWYSITWTKNIIGKHLQCCKISYCAEVKYQRVIKHTSI